MRRILVCNETLEAGGIGTYTRSLVEGLRGRGWRVGLMVTSGRGERAPDVAAGADVLIDLTGERLSLRKVARAAAAVRAEAPQVLVLNHCPLVQHALPMLGAGVRPVAVLHNDAERFYRVAALHARRVWRWIAPTPALGERIASRVGGGLGRRVRVVPHGVDPVVFHARGRRGAGGPLAVAFVGHLGENKGADLLPGIFAGISARVPGAQFTVLGQGGLRGRLEAECRGRGLAVAFRGYGTPGEVAAVLRATDLLLLPTRVEGFGLVIAEAMACGAVPVVTRLADVTDRVVADGVSGVLVAPGGAAGYAAAAVALAADRARLERLRAAAALESSTRFSSSRMLDDYQTLFGEGDERALPPARAQAGWLWEEALAAARGTFDARWFLRRLRRADG